MLEDFGERRAGANTLVLFSSETGGGCSIAKWTLAYELGLRSALCARGPDMDQGQGRHQTPH